MTTYAFHASASVDSLADINFVTTGSYDEMRLDAEMLYKGYQAVNPDVAGTCGVVVCTVDDFDGTCDGVAYTIGFADQETMSPEQAEAEPVVIVTSKQVARVNHNLKRLDRRQTCQTRNKLQATMARSIISGKGE